MAADCASPSKTSTVKWKQYFKSAKEKNKSYNAINHFKTMMQFPFAGTMVCPFFHNCVIKWFVQFERTTFKNCLSRATLHLLAEETLCPSRRALIAVTRRPPPIPCSIILIMRLSGLGLGFLHSLRTRGYEAKQMVSRWKNKTGEQNVNGPVILHLFKYTLCFRCIFYLFLHLFSVLLSWRCKTCPRKPRSFSTHWTRKNSRKNLSASKRNRPLLCFGKARKGNASTPFLPPSKKSPSISKRPFGSWMPLTPSSALLSKTR